MKITRISKVALLAMSVVVVASCGSHHKTVNETSGVSVDTLERQAFLQKVNDNSQYTRFITSKVKFGLEVGTRQMTLTGYLKMKRDDVIRLQLMAFGFVEAGRLEFTKDYMLVMDRINKLYFKVPYEQVTFLRNSNIDFNVMQGLFWAELFQPKASKVTDKLLKNYKTEIGKDESVISMDEGKLSYRWLASNSTTWLEMCNIMYLDRFRGNYQLNWDYENFQVFNRKYYPTEHIVTLTIPDKEIKMTMTFTGLDNDEDWETRTSISSKYLQVTIDEILARFMSL
jgi:hypothetical protein